MLWDDVGTIARGAAFGQSASSGCIVRLSKANNHFAARSGPPAVLVMAECNKWPSKQLDGI